MIFSIIIPIYNVEEYLSQTIESVLMQSFDQFELILIDDGSTDKSLEIAKSYKKKDNRILLVSQENKGVSTARNRGLALANGDYIFFMDSDDWILETTLATVHEKLLIKKYDFVCFAAQPFVDDLNMKIKDKGELYRFSNYYNRSYLNEREYSSEDYQQKMFQNNNYVGSGCLYMFKNSLVREQQLQYIDVFHEDNLFTRELLSHCENVFFIPKKLYQRRVRYISRSSSFLKDDFNSLKSFLFISERLFDLSTKKHNDINLLKGTDYYFYRALCMIKENYDDSEEFKNKLFRLYNKLNLKHYKYDILKLKHPFLAHYLIFIYRIKNKLNRLVKTKK